MAVQPKIRMTVDEFLAWAEDQPGRYELVDGEVFAMSPERVRHAEVKASVSDAFRAAIGKNGLPCRVLIDGVAVKIDAASSYVPDVLVYCGERADPDALDIPAPVIVVEVVSPSSTSIDTNRKLEGYFRVPSVAHYLIVEPKRPMVIHCQRGAGEAIETRVVSTGMLELSPPGMTVEVDDLFTRL